MKKNIIITAGPTNEKLDEVMKITNMSTGALGATIAKDFIEYNGDDIDKLYYVSTKLTRKPLIESSKLEFITIESTDDLLNVLRSILTSENIDVVIQSAAIGDYKARYSITGSMLASEIANFAFNNNLSREYLENGILNIIKNPSMRVSTEHKISSYEPDLMFMLDLTPKVIKNIKKWYPNTDLYGFKLLDGVSKEELIEVAAKLRESTGAKAIVANDKSKISAGKHPAYFVGEEGVEFEVQTKEEIAKTLRRMIF